MDQRAKEIIETAWVYNVATRQRLIVPPDLAAQIRQLGAWSDKYMVEEAKAK